ncbi:MAG: transcription termination/antitermination protein NusG [Bryobacterales bacterium]
MSEPKSQDELDAEPRETAADAAAGEQPGLGGSMGAEALPAADDSAADGDSSDQEAGLVMDSTSDDEQAAVEVSAEEVVSPEDPAVAADSIEAGSAEESPEETLAEAEEETPAAEAAGVPEGAVAAEPSPSEEAAPGAGQNGRQIGIPGMDWYIIHTYSGFENKVKESLRSRADAFGFGERIGEILIPTEDVVEMRSGKKVTSKRMLYPGYVLVQLEMDDELWHVVKNTPRVTGFVGGGQVPTPLTADEVNQTLYRQKTSSEKPRPKMSFEKNDRVKIVDGPFANFTGAVDEVNEDRSTLKVMVTIFGRGTPVELEYFQVEKEDG